MSKYTIRKLKKNAILFWQQDMEKFIVYPQSWGFFQLDQWNYLKVNHPFWILYWNPIPGFLLNVDGKEFSPDPEKIYLFPPHTSFSGKFCKPFIQFAIHFHAESPFDRVNNKMLVLPADAIAPLIMKLSDSNEKLQNTILLQQIILNALGQIPLEAFLPQKKPILDPRIREILQFVETNPGGRHTVQSLSEKVKMSVNNFHRKFVEGADCTPKQYLLKTRMEYAKKLMLETEMNIDEVALASGFMDRYHFSKAFKKYFDYSPASFRKNILQVSVKR